MTTFKLWWVRGMGILAGAWVLAAPAQATEVRVLTLNTWLLDFIASDIGARRSRIASEVHKLSPDIVSLQEVWGSRHKHYLIRKFRELGYPYAAYASEKGLHVLDEHSPFPDARFPVTVASLVPVPSFLSFKFLGGMFGGSRDDIPGSVFDISQWTNGLLTVSRHPLLKEFTHRMNFSVDTRLEERLVEKGAILTTAVLPDGNHFLVVNTHLGAQTYDTVLGEYDPDHYRKNYLQLIELVRWIAERTAEFRRAHGERFNVVLNGDLNFNYRRVEDRKWTSFPHPAYHALTGFSFPSFRLTDVYRRTASAPAKHAFTYGPVNPYGRRQGHGDPPSEVLDYVFVGRKPGWQIGEAKVVLTSPPGPGLIAVSDHFGVLAQVTIVQ